MSDTRWDNRALKGVIYHGKKYYTITPLPYYIKRQKLLLKEIEPYVLKSAYVCDFGCGNGEYISHFKNSLGRKDQFFGIDISQQMIEEAQIICPSDVLIVSDKGLDDLEKEVNFDLIYSIAVLAHIEINILTAIAKSIYWHLNKGGRFIFFEQVAPFNYSGQNFVRRTIAEYKTLFCNLGFEVEDVKLFSFDSHRFFEFKIAKFYYKYFCNKEENIDRRIEANNHLFFRLLSRFFLLFDFNPVKNNVENGWGNVFLVLKKRL